MNEEVLNDIKRLKGIVRAKKTHTVLDRLHLDLLKRAERLFKSGDDIRVAELGIAVATLDKAALASRARLADIRQRYSLNCGDGVLDLLLEKYFGKYILSDPLNELSSALTMLRAALLDGAAQTYDGRINGVRDAVSALSEEYSGLAGVIGSAADRAEYLISLGEIEHACSLIDAVHALPEIAGAPKASLRGYKRCFVKPFEKRFKDDFFEGFDLSAIIK